MEEKVLDNLRNAVIGGKPRLAVQETEQAIRDGYPKEQILNEGLLPAMHEISREFKKDSAFCRLYEFFLPLIRLLKKSKNFIIIRAKRLRRS